MKPYADCTLALLAGGRGTRLGGLVKGELLHPDGRSLSRRTVEDLGPRFGGVIAVGGPLAGLPGVADRIPARGAPGGLHTACAEATTPWVLVLASDLPGVRADVIDLLWAARDGADAVVPRTARGPEPLHALYRAARCAEVFGAALTQSDISAHALLALVHTRYVDEAALRAVDPELSSLRNVNTPEDLAAAGLAIPTARPT